MALSVKANDKCLVRHQDCKRIFGGSRICFVACPSSEEIALELEIIRQKLREVNIEPYIAVDQREFQKDIFCEKICTKIIESQFCIVILNDVMDMQDNVRIPNANVYYEYGLMTAFRKKIIPVQLIDQTLAFNIQSLDTLKYNRKDFASQIEEAIKMTLLNIEEEQNKRNQQFDESRLEWTLDLMGLIKAEATFGYRHERTLSSKSLGFRPFLKPANERVYYVGIFPPGFDNADVTLRAKMLTIRIKNYCEQMRNEIESLRSSDERRPRPSPMATERILDQEKILGQFAESKILIIKEDITDRESFIKTYEESVSELNFKLDIDILDDDKVRQLLES
jgi:hypothetical protein